MTQETLRFNPVEGYVLIRTIEQKTKSNVLVGAQGPDFSPVVVGLVEAHNDSSLVGMYAWYRKNHFFEVAPGLGIAHEDQVLQVRADFDGNSVPREVHGDDNFPLTDEDMRGCTPLYRLLVDAGPDIGETKTAGGVSIPSSANSFKAGYFGGMDDNRPRCAKVVRLPVLGKPWIGDNLRQVAKNWRMPEVGDTVWFGYTSWHKSSRGLYLMPMDEITLVVPADGSEPWLAGNRAAITTVEASMVSGGITVSMSAKGRIALGIIDMVGDGFREKFPEIGAGTGIAMRPGNGDNMNMPWPEGNKCFTRPQYVWSIVEGLEHPDNSEAKESAAKTLEATGGIVRAYDDQKQWKESFESRRDMEKTASTEIQYFT